MSNRTMTGAQVTELFNKAGRTKSMLAQNFANHSTDACISPCVIKYSNSVSDLIKKVPTPDKVTKIVTHAKEAISRLHQFKGRKSDFKFPKSMSVITRFLNEIDSVALLGIPPLATLAVPQAETVQGRGVVEPNVPTERPKAQNVSNTDDMNVSDSEQARRPVTVFVNNTTAPATGKATSAKKRKTNKVDELSREARDNNAADTADKLSFRRSTDPYHCGKLIVLPYSSLPKMNRDTSAYQTAIHCIDASQVKEIEAARTKAERRTKERSKKSLSAPCFRFCGNEDHTERDYARFIATESEISVKQARKRLERLLAQDPSIDSLHSRVRELDNGADVLAAKLQFDVVQYDAAIFKRTRLNEILVKKMADVPELISDIEEEVPKVQSDKKSKGKGTVRSKPSKASVPPVFTLVHANGQPLSHVAVHKPKSVIPNVSDDATSGGSCDGCNTPLANADAGESDGLFDEPDLLIINWIVDSHLHIFGRIMSQVTVSVRT
ncbi:hypothetical protein C8J56DRAFT_1068517 [Mycena floridula]|nr:hypothetical protein C8J56DRAFT_1068517 [Mycena floridula]